MEDIEAHLRVLHNLFMEVNDCLNDLVVAVDVETFRQLQCWMNPWCLLQSVLLEVARRLSP